MLWKAFRHRILQKFKTLWLISEIVPYEEGWHFVVNVCGWIEARWRVNSTTDTQRALIDALYTHWDMESNSLCTAAPYHANEDQEGAPTIFIWMVRGGCSQARKQHSYMNDTPSVRLTDDVKWNKFWHSILQWTALDWLNKTLVKREDVIESEKWTTIL